jgi:hypothetical protein
VHLNCAFDLLIKIFIITGDVEFTLLLWHVWSGEGVVE